MKKKILAAVLLSVSFQWLIGCAEEPPEREGHEVIDKPAPIAQTDPVPQAAPAAPATAPTTEDPRIGQMRARITELEKQLAAKKIAVNGVIPPATDLRGALPEVKPLPNDPEVGFVHDEAVRLYRKAMILYQASKYPEAILGFSTFLEKFPDHAWAGSAQFYVGESYYKQKEYKLAQTEYQRVLTTYDRSVHVAHALHQLSDVEDILKRHEEAARHRQLLTSLFPQSPAAVLKVSAAAAVHQDPAAQEPPPVVAPEIHPALEQNTPPAAAALDTTPAVAEPAQAPAAPTAAPAAQPAPPATTSKNEELPPPPAMDPPPEPGASAEKAAVTPESMGAAPSGGAAAKKAAQLDPPPPTAPMTPEVKREPPPEAIAESPPPP